MGGVHPLVGGVNSDTRSVITVVLTCQWEVLTHLSVGGIDPLVGGVNSDTRSVMTVVLTCKWEVFTR